MARARIQLSKKRKMLTHHYPQQGILWGMDPHSFNEWRATNDIPVLFEKFSEMLPGFRDWIRSLPFDDRVMMRVVPSGDLFKGAATKVVIDRPGDVPDQRVIECFPADELKARVERYTDAKNLGEFLPYFLWANQNLGEGRFFSYDPLNFSRTDTFSYNSWTGVKASHGITQAYLFKNIPVLKLGQFTLAEGVVISSRNLDFCDLDFLCVEGMFHGSYWLNVNYSSCREIRFDGAEVAFYTFHQCAMPKFSAINSRLQDFYFEKCDINDFRLTNCFANKIGFSDSRVMPFLDNCELREVNYKPANATPYSETARTFRLLRIAFQSSGMRQEASECYFKERVYERKSIFRPYLLPENRGKFPNLPHGGTIGSMLNLIDRGLIDRADRKSALAEVIKSRLKILFYPRYFSKLIPYKTRWLFSLVQSVLWGYGERPLRIAGFAVLVISIYAACYYNHQFNGGQILRDWYSCIYFSTVTFTTLGYGDIYPTSPWWRLLCASEALIGAFTMGLVVAGFSNRSRY